jgi:signal transduction histidine kinase
VAPDPDERPQDRREVAAGDTLAVVLSRGGRVVATLRVTAGRDLGPDDVRTLVAAGDVLTSALANAELFSQQVELIARMRTVDELKTVFLATASHELRTPVVALAGYANLLHSGWDDLAPQVARGYAERVDSIAQRLHVLVEDILDFSRLQSGSGPGAVATILDLAETVERVLDEQAELAPDHHVVHEPGPGLRVSGSRQAVERVVTNLVGNAAKYSDAGGTIRVLTREVDGHAELVVEDEGPGIPADQREQVFSPFYRGSGDEVVRTRGAGLGLAIVAEFAASMGGHVRVDEASGGGASFVVSYPIAAPDPLLETGLTHVQA